MACHLPSSDPSPLSLSCPLFLCLDSAFLFLSEQMQMRRKHTFWRNFFATEKSFVRVLELICKTFYHTLKDLVSPEDCRLLFDSAQVRESGRIDEEGRPTGESVGVFHVNLIFSLVPPQLLSILLLFLSPLTSYSTLCIVICWMIWREPWIRIMTGASLM